MKTTAELITSAIMAVQKAHTDAMDVLNKRIKMLMMLREAGLDLMRNEWAINCWCHDIKREDLMTVRKVFGRLKVTGTDVPYDYKQTGQILVAVKPMKEEFSHITFRYRKPYKGDGKCKIVEQVSTYQTLVCTK